MSSLVRSFSAVRVLAVLGLVAFGVAACAAKKAETPLEREKEKGKAYVEKAAKEKGAVKTSSGLVIVPMKKGTGPSPTAADTVRVHYVGTLVDGTKFDSSVDRNEPAEFPLNRVIPCWTEGVQKLQVGGKAKLVCPASIAYGDQGAGGGLIPGGATLVFEVELLGIVNR